MGDGTQIWKITHNGVDTHSIHFHLFNVQLLYSLWLGTTGVGSHDLYNPPAMSGLSTTVSDCPSPGTQSMRACIRGLMEPGRALTTRTSLSKFCVMALRGISAS